MNEGGPKKPTRESVLESLGETLEGRVLKVIIERATEANEGTLTLGVLRAAFAEEDISVALSELLAAGYLAINRQTTLSAEQIATLNNDALIEHGDTSLAQR